MRCEIRKSESQMSKNASGRLSEYAPVSLHLLGGLRLRSQASEDHSIGNRHHVRAVLALAGSRSQGIDRDELIELLWPQAAAAQGRNRLYHTMHLARQALSALAWDDEWLVIRQSRVLLDERVWCDARRLDQVLERGDKALSNDELDALVPLCRGEWVPGLLIGEQADAIRVRVRKAQATVLRRVVERDSAQGDTPGLRGTLHSLLELETTDEWAYRESMRLDLAAGRQHAVLHTFEKLSQQLASQLGLRPSAESVALRDAARSGLVAQQSELLGGDRVHAVVGRESMVQDLKRQLTASAGVWSLTGPSGIGKTTVVREIARRMRAEFPDAIFVVNLGDLGPHATVASACAQVLGLVVGQARDEHGLLQQALRTRRMLLVLDDLDATGQARSIEAGLTQEGMQARVIVTSRAPMSWVAGRVMAVTPLQSPDADASSVLAMRAAAYALFDMRCPLAGPERDSKAWRADAVRLVRYLEGSPLAIELAAARTVTMTPGEILDQIARNLHPLASGPLDMAPRHQSLQASLDWSVKLLGPVASQVYENVAVFPGAFERGDALELSCAVGVEPDAATAGIDELVAAGLVVASVGGRLRMLHLPRAHARALAGRRGTWEQIATARWASICRHFAAAPMAHESPLYMAHGVVVAGLEEGAVALLEHAAGTDPAGFVRVVVELCELWIWRGSLANILQWVERGIAHAASLAMAVEELRLRSALIFARRKRSGAMKALEEWPAAAALIDRVGDTGAIARAAEEHAMSLAQSGGVVESNALLGSTIERLGLVPSDAGYWTLTIRRTMSGLVSGSALDVAALRKRFAGSNLWIDVLRAAHGDIRFGVDWKKSLELAEEIVACSRSMHSLATMVGIWTCGVSHFGLDEPAEGLRRFEEGYRWASAAGLTEMAMDARIYMSAWHRYVGDLDAVERCLKEVDEHGENRDLDPIAVLLPLQRAAALVMRDKPVEAVASFLDADHTRLPRVRDADLARWLEAGAMVAGAVGDVDSMAELAGLLRRFDAQHDIIPVVRRFRDRVFGVGGCDRAPDEASALVMRGQARSLLAALHRTLAER